MEALDTRPTLVTGAAGFIGVHVACRLLADGHRVVGVDNLNDYYDPALISSTNDHRGGRVALRGVLPCVLPRAGSVSSATTCSLVSR